MDFDALIRSLQRMPRVLSALLEDMSRADARWKPEPEHWSVLEIICHLADEEVEDFRARVKLTLESPETAWPKIDPEGVAVKRKYNEQDLQATFKRFVDERESSLAWLRSLKNPDWDRAYDYPGHGPVPAGEVMVSWVAHDQLHLRQISKRLYEMSIRDGAPFIADYAGKW